MTTLLLIALLLIVVAVVASGPGLARRPRRRIVETVYEERDAVADTRGDPTLIDRRMVRPRRRIG